MGAGIHFDFPESGDESERVPLVDALGVVYIGLAAAAACDLKRERRGEVGDMRYAVRAAQLKISFVYQVGPSLLIAAAAAAGGNSVDLLLRYASFAQKILY